VYAAFGTTAFRRRLLSDLERWTEQTLVPAADAIDAVLIGGSFVSSNAAPNDIDCSIILDSTVDAGVALKKRIEHDGARVRRDHRIALARKSKDLSAATVSASEFWLRSQLSVSRLRPRWQHGQQP
jgi:hypothetical protein